MSKSLEQAVHEFDVPQPATAGEDFHTYLHRVVFAAHMSGAAWAIANGPQVRVPDAPSMKEGTLPEDVAVPTLEPEEWEGDMTEPVADPTFDHPITVDGVPAEERGDDSLRRVMDAATLEDQDTPTEIVTER